jgi:hypothetical protein
MLASASIPKGIFIVLFGLCNARSWNQQKHQTQLQAKHLLPINWTCLVNHDVRAVLLCIPRLLLG